VPNKGALLLAPGTSENHVGTPMAKNK